MKYVAVCFVVLLSGCGAKVVQPPVQPPQRPVRRHAAIVYLNQSRDWTLSSTPQYPVCPLARELVRQAVLLAARDELGLATRDAWLGDAMPTEGENAPLDVVMQLHDPLFVEIVSGFPPSRMVLARHEVNESMRPLCNANYCLLTELEESLSRTELVAGLKKGGFQGRSNRRDENIAVPEQIERLLSEMNFLSQFHAVRELHGRMRSKGESSVMLGALVRGYANLGVLTEFHWHPAHKVFKARALLYAQRMLARDEKSPVARWHRSYAAAMAGIHCWALSDLREADKVRQAMAEKDRPPMPAWARFIGPLCRYEVEELGKHVKDPHAGQLAALLRFLAVDQVGGRTWPVQTALEALETIPECYRVHNTLCAFAGVSTLHSATLAPVKLAGETIYGRVDSMPGLPQKVGAVIRAKNLVCSQLWQMLVKRRPPSPEGEFLFRQHLMDALLGEGELNAVNAGKVPAFDSGEPSWAVLGGLIRELSFVQVGNRARFEYEQWSVPTEEWLKQSSPLVKGHPYRPFLEIYAWMEQKRKDAASRLTKMDLSGCDLGALPLFNSRSSTEFVGEVWLGKLAKCVI